MPTLAEAQRALATGSRQEADNAMNFIVGVTDGGLARKFPARRFTGRELKLSDFGGPSTPQWIGDTPIYQDAAMAAALQASHDEGRPIAIEGMVWLDPDNEGQIDLSDSFARLEGSGRFHDQIKAAPGSTLSPIRTPQTSLGDSVTGSTGYALKNLMIDFGWDWTGDRWVDAAQTAADHANHKGLDLVAPNNNNPDNHDTAADIGFPAGFNFQDAMGIVDNVVLCHSPNMLLNKAGRSEVNLSRIWGFNCAGNAINWQAYDTWMSEFSFFATGGDGIRFDTGAGMGGFVNGKFWFNGLAQDGPGGRPIHVDAAGIEGLQFMAMRTQDSSLGCLINGRRHRIDIQVDAAAALSRDYALTPGPTLTGSQYALEIQGDGMIIDAVIRDRKAVDSGAAANYALRMRSSAENNQVRLSADPANFSQGAVYDQGTNNLITHLG